MPKNPPASAQTEIIVAGQPSAALVAELKAAGERVTTAHLCDAIRHLEAARVGFVVEATATGILLLARKGNLPHGAWQKFCGEIWEAVQTANGKRVSHLPEAALHNFTRSLRHYSFLAQHFLADLEQGKPQTDGELRSEPPAVKPAEVLALDTLPQEQRILVYNTIERWVAGRSLRRILIDFRRAEYAADQEEIDEAKRRKPKKPVDPRQMDFYDDMQRPLGEIDRLMDDTAVRDTVDRDYWLQLAKALEEQAKRARELAKEARS